MKAGGAARPASWGPLQAGKPSCRDPLGKCMEVGAEEVVCGEGCTAAEESPPVLLVLSPYCWWVWKAEVA